MEKKLKELQEKIAQHQKGKRWGNDLKTEILKQAQNLYQQHKNWRKVADILGLKKADLNNMRKEPKPKSEEASFALAIIEQEEDPNITVTSPNGFSLQGLNFEQALKAMEVFACSK